LVPAAPLVTLGLLIQLIEDVKVLLLAMVESPVGRGPGPRRRATITRWLAQRLLAGR
jgi:hypothetical protein